MLKLVLDFFFPPCCGVCGKSNDDWLCSECSNKLNVYKKSRILNIVGKEYSSIIFLFYYVDIRKLLLKYKFYEKGYLNNTFVTIILREKKICGLLKKYDLIIPVPMTKLGKAKRGYNQTELIAKKIAKNLNIGYGKNILLKTRNNKTQSTLNESDRFENVKNVFDIKNNDFIKNKNVILFDDIVTTGATIDACSKVLKKNGVNDILILSLAKD